jgi:hypothetical protein
MKYRSIILQACSEIDVLFKLLCGFKIKDSHNMDEYRDHFSKNYPGFDSIEVLISSSFNESKSLQSWQFLTEGGTYKFWRDYEHLKHQGKL